MNVLVSVSSRLAIDSSGTLWSANAAQSYSLWERYLDVYDEVRLCARARPVETPPENWARVTGPGVVALPIPYFQGPEHYVRQYLPIRRAVSSALRGAEAVQLRLSCPVARQIWSMLQKGRPYGVEVVNDPYDSFAPGSVSHPLRPFFRWWIPRIMRRQCRQASAALYVTREALQRRYPCPPYMTGVSDVDIQAADLVAESRPVLQAARPLVLVYVGTMAQLYKAPNVLIDAVAAGVREGLDLKLVLVGDGKHRPELEAQASAHGLGERVTFRGQLASKAKVRDELDQADLFVLPSFQEGLPRAMVEAMARGLPCIGSTVGGIPELLPADDMVPPGDAAALTGKIREIVTNPQRMAEMSQRNLATAREYQFETLREKRNAFYRYVRRQTDAWLQQQQRTQKQTSTV